MCVLGVRCLCRHNTSSSSCILPHRGKLLIIKQHIVTCVLTSKNHLHFQCYYIGAADISATKLVREVTKPLAFGKPTEKICEALKKKDEQICELRYGRNQPLSYIIGERERANLVVQTPQYFYYPRLYVVQLRMHQDYVFFHFYTPHVIAESSQRETIVHSAQRQSRSSMPDRGCTSFQSS